MVLLYRWADLLVLLSTPRLTPPLFGRGAGRLGAFPEVDVQQADLIAVAKNAVVSPANGYGFMDGGIDAAYVRLFGGGIKAKVQEAGE